MTIVLFLLSILVLLMAPVVFGVAVYLAVQFVRQLWRAAHAPRRLVK